MPAPRARLLEVVTSNWKLNVAQCSCNWEADKQYDQETHSIWQCTDEMQWSSSAAEIR